MCSNVYDISQIFIKNIKIQISWERNILIIKRKNPFMIHFNKPSMRQSEARELIGYLIVPASARSYKIGVIGNNWLVGNAVISETALRIFLIFCIKLGDYKGREVTGPDF